MTIPIRQETPADHAGVYDLVKEAFASAEHADGKEQDLAATLRTGGSFLPKLSLVAELEGELAGHILFTKAKVGADPVLVLAPLSVKPKFQRMGVGTALIHEGHNIAASLGYSYSLVLDSETYYPRMGYLPAEQLGVTVPEGIPSANFMASQLRENAKPLAGTITYPKEFGL